MSDGLVDIRTPLAASNNPRVELGGDGLLQVLAGPVTAHMDRATCEELRTTIARAMIALAKLHPKTRPPVPALVRDEGDDCGSAAVQRGGQYVR